LFSTFTSNSLLSTWHDIHDAFLEKSSKRLFNSRLDAALDVINGSVLISAQVLFKFSKPVVI
jgi:hypothetical protein